MVSVLNEALCVTCTKVNCIAMCYGCQQSYCTKHFFKHRLHLSQQMDALDEKFGCFQQDLNQDSFENPLLTSIYAWERKSIRKTQEIAEKARNDLQEWMDNTKSEVQDSFNKINTELQSHAKSDNYTELDLDRWTKQLSELKNSLEKSPTILIVKDKKPSSTIRGIKISKQQVLDSTLVSEHPVTKPIQERFISMYGPCKISEEDRVIIHSSYRAGLSQISGVNEYTSGKHSIDFLIEKKGSKNIFLGIHSSSEQLSSPTFDYSVHGWWNLDYIIINGESQVGDNNEIIQTGDQITLTLDCNQQQIQLEHHRTKRLVHIPIKLDICPYPWKILVRLLNGGDCVRILS